MSDEKKVWVDPDDCGLVIVEAAERQRRERQRKQREEEEFQRREETRRKLREEADRKSKVEAEQKRREHEERQRRWEAEEAMKRKKEEEAREKTQGLAAQPKLEILPPALNVPELPALAVDTIAVPDLSEFERQIRIAARMLDLSQPEGWLDSLFGRPDHRINVKTDRAQLLAGYIAAITAILQAASGFQDARRQAYLDQLVFLRRVAEENINLELTRRQVERQDAIESAKAKAEIAKHDADAREHGLRGRPLPPPLPAPPAPKPEDPRAKNKARLQKDLERLATEEKADLAKISGGKPQSEWTDEVHEEIKRTVNMYYHAKEKVREELQKCL